MRSDLIISLIKASSEGDQHTVRMSLEAMDADERTRQHHVLADRLANFLDQPRWSGAISNCKSDAFFESIGLVSEVGLVGLLGDLVLPEVVKNLVNELIEGQHRADLLRSYRIEPRNMVLLEGSPVPVRLLWQKLLHLSFKSHYR